jgi:integrase
MAKVTFSLIRQMMRFAETRDIIENDPTHKIDKKQIGGADKERDRTLCATDDKPDELKGLIKKIPLSGLKDTSQAGLFICLATCCRIGELLKAKWEHVDLETSYWQIPSENSKNGKAHSVYLSDFALKYFQTLKSKTSWSLWLFPSNKTNEEVQTHIETRNITKQVGDRQKDKKDILEKRTQKSDSLILPHGKWTPHDLRRTSATLMIELGVMPEVVERCLNHAEDNKVKRTYQRYSYKSQMKEAWELLGDRLIVLRDGGENVVTLKQTV